MYCKPLHLIMMGKNFISRVSFLTFVCSLLLFSNGVIAKNYQFPNLRDAENESSEESNESEAQRSSAVPPLKATPFEVKYLLYTGGDQPETFTYKDIEDSVKINYIPNVPWKILIHGFMNNAKTAFPTNVREAYEQQMNVNRTAKNNILVMDWGEGATASTIFSMKAPYHNAVENVKDAGEKLGDLLIKFHEANNISFYAFHLIGHSLGSHVAAHAARRVWDKTKLLLWRISALDPAGPLFWREPLFGRQHPYPRLHRNRVVFLDVYHTSKLFGSTEDMGDVDFYINGGETQPSCKFQRFSFFNWITPDMFFQQCSHSYATKIFAKSINDKTMKACTGCYNYEEYKDGTCECEDEPVLGEFVTEETFEYYPLASGTAYISTTEAN